MFRSQIPAIQSRLSVFVVSSDGWKNAQPIKAIPTRITFSATANHRAAIQDIMRRGSGGQLKKGDTAIGTSGT